MSMQTVVYCSFLLCITTVCAAHDTMNPNQPLTGNQTLVSADETFELGFFSPQNSEKQYLGIWFKKPRPITVVWVANREISLPKNSAGALKLTDHGVLVVLGRNNTLIWSSNSSRTVQNPVAQLLSSGNLVVRDKNDEDPENFVWQSFDYPSDTMLPGFKLGRVRPTGLDRFLTSWRSPEDPSPGNTTWGLLFTGYPQIVQWEGSVIKSRVGPWNGLRFSGTLPRDTKPLGTFKLVLTSSEIYCTYDLLKNSILYRLVLSPRGIVEEYLWFNPDGRRYVTVQTDSCDAYALCGAYGSCSTDNSPLCQCISGFVPKFPEEWDRFEWFNGCVRSTPLNCTDDVFLKYSGLKLPDTQRSWFNTTVNLEDCKMICKKNCSCMAYANLDIRDGGSGCLLWFGDLLDIRKNSNEVGLDIHIRMDASEAEKLVQKHMDKKHVVIILSSAFSGMIALGLGAVMYFLCKKKQLDAEEDIHKEDFELPLIDFAAITTATNNFSPENKLGEGGFGPVYKGIMKENQEVAVKRLSRNSNQGLNEFRNEVICIAKLQHRNLVKLVGCCIQQEKMLVYEYMPNKSLDFFIFDKMERKLLNWQTRFHIINGIARGLLYLHQDSRLRIVHRDLKASNVLLDHEMNPKISDFGLARSFGGNETEANTKRVVGTYGYMSPEYAVDGIFSVKSDVFSYGVLVLEIVTGKQNRGFSHPDHYHNLLGHAWNLFKEGKSLELIDEVLESLSNVSEVSRSIHVALLCVQRSPEDRPSMPTVVLMLSSDNALPEPKEPGFYMERDVFDAGNKTKPFSNNGISLTLLCPR